MRPDASSSDSKHAEACDSCVAGSVILRSRINPSEAKTRQSSAKYYRLFWSRSLTGAAFRPVTGRPVNPQVVGSSPTRGASIHAACSDAGRFVFASHFPKCTPGMRESMRRSSTRLRRRLYLSATHELGDVKIGRFNSRPRPRSSKVISGQRHPDSPKAFHRTRRDLLLAWAR